MPFEKETIPLVSVFILPGINSPFPYPIKASISIPFRFYVMLIPKRETRIFSKREGSSSLASHFISRILIS